MRRSGPIITAFILVFVLVIIEIIIVKSASKYEPKLGIVFAKVKIPEKTVITPDMIEIKDVGIGFVHRLSIRDAGNVTAKRAEMDIEAGEMMLSSKLGSNEMEQITVKDKSKRLFSVEFKGDQANGWWLMTDQNVDIIFVPDKADSIRARVDTVASKGINGRTAAVEDLYSGMQVLKDIRIAALIDDKGSLLENSKRTSLPIYVSFEVTNEQANFLAYAKSNGRLEMSAIPGQ